MRGCPICAWFESGKKPKGGMLGPPPCDCKRLAQNTKEVNSKSQYISFAKNKELPADDSFSKGAMNLIEPNYTNNVLPKKKMGRPKKVKNV